jgi:sulfur-carrier protein
MLVIDVVVPSSNLLCNQRDWMPTIRVELPAHLRTLARVAGHEVQVEVAGTPTIRTVLDVLEANYPMLQGTIRDHVTQERRAFLRFFACQQDLSLDSADAPLPEAVVRGTEPLIVLGAVAGGIL